MTLFSKEFTQDHLSQFNDAINGADSLSIPSILTKQVITFNDFLTLLSPNASPHLEHMAARAHQVSLNRFGRTISLYAPLYVSNECVNTCTYCGFSRPNKIKRRTLSLIEVEHEAKALREKGIQNVLILTGESPKKNPIPYLLDVVKTIRPYFHSIQIEIYPVETEDYRSFSKAGVEGVTLYQETYDRDTYSKIHTAGFKKDFDFRIDTPQRAADAGVRKITIGALLGLAPWRVEMAALAHHLRFLEKEAYRSALALSFPRIKEAAFYTKPEHLVSDRDFVQILCAFRLFSPNSGINVSTRESANFRDSILSLGVTSMSAGSRTDIGGYSGEANSTEQFSLDDLREPGEVASAISANGYQPVFKDWDFEIGHSLL